MADLLHDAIIAVASFLGNPRDVLAMARVCVAWYGALESDRTRLLAWTFGVEPLARCSGSTSLGDALGLWNMYLHAKHVRIMECDIDPGMTIPLRTQLALIEPPKTGPGLQSFLGYRVTLTSSSPSERRYALADGLMTHATLFGNALRPGLQRMWKLCNNAREHGRCLYLLLASPMESIPIEDLVQMYNIDRFVGVMMVLHHAFKPLLEKWTDDQINTRAVTFVTRFTQFVGHPAMRSRFVSAYYREYDHLPFSSETIDMILGKLVSKCTANCDALDKARTACLDVFDRGVIVDIVYPFRGIFLVDFVTIGFVEEIPGH